MSTPHEGSPFITAPNAGFPGANEKVLEYKTGLQPLGPVSARQRRQSKSKKTKPKNPERENTTLVFGPVETLDKFLELLAKVKQGFPEPEPEEVKDVVVEEQDTKVEKDAKEEKAGKVETATTPMIPTTTTPTTAAVGVRSHYYREHQKCGFVYFHNEASTAQAKAAHNKATFDDVEIRVCSPMEYFENEVDALPNPPNRSSSTIDPAPAVAATEARNLAPRRQSHTPATMGAGAGNPACTLVLKNINYNMKQEKLLEQMSQLGIPPQSVNYHYDQNGTFRGVAFAKYKRVDDATRAFEKLSGLEVAGRTLRVEYKRRMSMPVVHVNPRQRLQSISSIPAAFSFPDSFGGETFDPQNMDPEQLDIFTKLTRFNQDPSKTEMIFPNTMPMSQRNNVHMVAEFLNLHHVSSGPPDARFVVVTKRTSRSVEHEMATAFRSRVNSAHSIRSRHASFDMTVGSPLQPPPNRSPSLGFRTLDPHNLPRSRVQPQLWSPKGEFVCPKGPDGSRGFGGRRVSMPVTTLAPPQAQGMMANYRVDMQQPSLLPQPQAQGQQHGQPPHPRSPTRSASVPVVVMRDEFS